MRRAAHDGATNSVVPETVEAQQFLLRDSSGKLRGAMGVLSDGAVGLNLSDPNGRTRVTVDLARTALRAWTSTIRMARYARPWRSAMPVNPESVCTVPMVNLRTSLDVPKQQNSRPVVLQR